MAGQAATAAIKERLRTLTGAARSGGVRDMADLVDMPFHNVNRYVHGPGVPPHDFLAAVADRYNVTLDWLYGRSQSGGVKEAEQMEPAWARRMDARLRYIERQLKGLPTGAAWKPMADLAARLATAEDIGDVEAPAASRTRAAPGVEAEPVEAARR